MRVRWIVLRIDRHDRPRYRPAPHRDRHAGSRGRASLVGIGDRGQLIEPSHDLRLALSQFAEFHCRVLGWGQADRPIAARTRNALAVSDDGGSQE